MKMHVFFDLHHTLIEKKHSYYEHACDIFREYDIVNTIGAENAIEFDTKINKMVLSLPASYFNNSVSSRRWIEVFTNSLIYYGVMRDNAEFVARCIYERLSDASSWVLFDDVIDTFKYLKINNISYGFLSNWDIRMKVLWEGLSILMDERDAISLFSYELDLYKPDPQLFKAYIDKVKQRFGQIDKFIYVGDDVATDKGGESLGVEFVLVDRNNQNFNLRSTIEKKIRR